MADKTIVNFYDCLFTHFKLMKFYSKFLTQKYRSCPKIIPISAGNFSNNLSIIICFAFTPFSPQFCLLKIFAHPIRHQTSLKKRFRTAFSFFQKIYTFLYKSDISYLPEKSLIISSIITLALSISMLQITLNTRSRIFFSVFDNLSIVFRAL